MRIILNGVEAPVLPGVSVGVQRGSEIVDKVPADGSPVTWQFDATFARGELRGPYVHGKPGDRFFYLSWSAEGTGRFRRAKLMLDALDPAALEGAGIVEATFPLVLPDGSPLCAAVRPPLISWSVSSQ
jgi:hypothetical protein